ncbi:hypothetical protein ACFDTO_23575 [Microbacteriaceae bacterium 4G12]
MFGEISAMVGAATSGASLGVILWALAKKYNKNKLGIIGFILCFISHFMFGFLLSLPCFSIIFTLILREKDKK